MRTHALSATLSLAVGLALAGGVPAVAAKTHPQTAATKRSSGDAASLSLLAAVNQQEIDLADQALSKGVQGGVRDFANTMKTEHGKNLEDTKAVATANALTLAETGTVKAQKAKGAAEAAKLAKLDGAAYSRAYVDAMVKGHAEVLMKLDKVLIPQASDPEVVAHLKATRTHVAAHLDAAKALQAASAK